MQTKNSRPINSELRSRTSLQSAGVLGAALCLLFFATPSRAETAMAEGELTQNRLLTISNTSSGPDAQLEAFEIASALWAMAENEPDTTAPANTCPTQGERLSENYHGGGVASGVRARQHLETFDELDFEVFSSQDWARLHLSHADNVTVTWPDGRVTSGIDVHIEDLKKLFIHAPDTRIKIHPIRIGAGKWTAVMGVMEGTFTNPMPTGDGDAIAPTGCAFAVNMATIAVWEQGRMIHEWLFWDNQTYLRQLGFDQ